MRNKAIAEMAKITDYGSIQLSALCPFETAYREFTLTNGEKFVWYSAKSDELPQRDKEVLLMARGTKEGTLKRVFISYKNNKGIMKTVGMRKADKSLVNKLFE